MSGVTADQIYGHLARQKFLPEEEKGCRKRSRWTNDLLCIDRSVIREVKSRKKNLAMAWIDYKKTYDMVPHSWIKECLEFFGVADNINTLLDNSVEKWRVMLCARNSEVLILFFISFSVCFSIDPIKFDFKKGEGSIWVFRKQIEDYLSFIYGWFEVI